MPHNVRRKAALTLCAVAWAACASGGLIALAVYGNTPGAAGAPPAQWPANTALHGALDRPNLLVFLHPYCPCSQATLYELARLVRSARSLVQVHVVMLDVPNAANDPRRSPLWRSAAQIPTVRVVHDPQGRESRRFAIRTSGAALLYDRSGVRRFHGGLTASRGHAGDNAGVDSILAILRGEAGLPSAPVFGCPLFDYAPCESAGDGLGEGEPCCG